MDAFAKAERGILIVIERLNGFLKLLNLLFND